jgi:hypothetical protein
MLMKRCLHKATTKVIYNLIPLTRVAKFKDGRIGVNQNISKCLSRLSCRESLWLVAKNSENEGSTNGSRSQKVHLLDLDLILGRSVRS